MIKKKPAYQLSILINYIFKSRAKKHIKVQTASHRSNLNKYVILLIFI
jgi:hypothetical protein